MPTAMGKHEKFVDGVPPEGVAETRTFGAVLSFRAMACDYCRFGPYDSCDHYGGMRERVLADGLFQCPEYRRKVD